MTLQTDELLAYLFDGRPHLLAQPMGEWVESSRRFAAFANTFRDKIRKKLRTTQDPNNLLDLRAELETAYLLLRERSLSLVYEPEQSKGIRSPDFAVTFTTSLTFMVEVTRVQTDSKVTAGARLAEAVAEKLGPLLPQRGNILVVAIEAAHLTASDVANALLALQHRAEKNDAAVVQGHGFLDRADFFRYYLRLSEVIVRVQHPEAAPMLAWVNPQAKFPLPGRVRTALYRSFTG